MGCDNYIYIYNKQVNQMNVIVTFHKLAYALQEYTFN